MAVRDIDSAPRTGTRGRSRTQAARTTVAPTGHVSTSRSGVLTPDAPTRTSGARSGVRPHIPHSKSRGRLGSQQVVSVRGRRVSPAAAKHPLAAVGHIALVLLVIGVAAAMVLSAMSTTQTFAIQQLQSQEREVTNQVESLNRDLEDMRSAAEVAQRAAQAGMVVATEPGIIEVGADGHIEQRREYKPDTEASVVDVNGAPTRAGRASSDQRATREVGEALTQLPGNGNAPAVSVAPAAPGESAPPVIDNVAPYQHRIPSDL